MKRHVLSTLVVAFAVACGEGQVDTLNSESSVDDAALVGRSGRKFGIAAGGGGFVGRRDQDERLNRVAESGVGWFRVGFDWNAIEGSGKGRFNWQGHDAAVAKLQSKGVKVLAVVGYTPCWARVTDANGDCAPDHTYAPKRVEDFADYVQAVVERYDGDGIDDAPGGLKVHAIEVWNENNWFVFFKKSVAEPVPDVNLYARLLINAFVQAKRANPNIIVVSGGMAPAPGRSNPTVWLADLYKVIRDFRTGYHMTAEECCFDAVGHHPYNFGGFPDQKVSWNAFQQMSWSEFSTQPVYPNNFGVVELRGKPMPSLRQTMIANGDGAKTIWATEFGAPSAHYEGVSEATQAQTYQVGMNLWKSYPWAGVLFAFNIQEWDKGSRDGTMGILRFDGTPKPSFGVIKRITRAE